MQRACSHPTYDAHHLSHSGRHKTTEGTDLIEKQVSNISMTITDKRSHHCRGNPPRLKPRHSPSSHKKKHRNGRKHIPTHPPCRGGMRSKSPPPMKYHGKLWIRPDTAKSAMPFVSTASPDFKKEYSYFENGYFGDPLAPVSPSNHSLVHQVTEYPPEEDQRSTHPRPCIWRYRRRGSGPKNAVTQPDVGRGNKMVTFGESGKPIKPRDSFETASYCAIWPLL